MTSYARSGLTGASSVVEAMASGREGVISVDRFIRNEGLRWGRGIGNGAHIDEFRADLSHTIGGGRGNLKRLAPDQRTLHEEVEKTLTPERAREEAERCMSCGRAVEVNRACWYCLPCEIECPVRGLHVRVPYLIR